MADVLFCENCDKLYLVSLASGEIGPYELEQDFRAFDDGNLVPVDLHKTTVVDWGIKAIHADVAWKLTKGEGVHVAVLDTGYSDHLNLAPNIVGKYGFADSSSGHSTHVSGAIAAAEVGYGVIGVAPKASISQYGVIPGAASGIVQAIQHATANNVDIISMSLGAYVDDPDLHAAIKMAHAAGVIIVAAAGNDPTKVSFPGAYPEVIAVSAVGPDFNRASFAPLTTNHIACPGVQEISTYLNQGYAYLSGTSQATPLMSGTIALALALHKPAKAVRQAWVQQELATLDQTRGDFFFVPNLEDLK